MADRRFTDLELERSLAGDLPAARTAALASEATADDKARLEELRSEHAAFLGGIDVDAEVRRIQQRVERAKPEPARPFWVRWLAPAGVLVAAAAAVVIFVVARPAHNPTEADPDFQTKGDTVSLVIYVKTGDASQRLQNGDTIAPGAKLRFEIEGMRRGYIAVVGVDGSGQTSVYYPSGTSESAKLGDDRLLHVAIQLDATPGDEQFFAVYSAQPFVIDTALSALRTTAAGGTGALPPGLAASHVVLHKK